MNQPNPDRPAIVRAGPPEAAVLAFAQAGVLFSALRNTDSHVDSVMRGLDDARQTLIGRGQMTVNINLNPDAAPEEAFHLQRIWSSNPGFDPVGGRKRKEDKPWTRTVLRKGQVFIGEGADAIAGSFDDHERLRSIGLHAIVNVPIAPHGKCLAILNVLTTRPSWTDAEIALLQLFALIAKPSILLRRDEVIKEFS
ncbi:MAG TPA: GAF domain-containing protein [Bordetella sp.]|nr:GAF domain-containing protein [Bordetella sp.]